MKKLLAMAALAITLTACTNTPTGTTTVTTTPVVSVETVAKVKTDLQRAITAYGIAKGIASVGLLADPTLDSEVAVIEAKIDPLVAQANTLLAASDGDPVAMTSVFTEISSLIASLEVSTAPKITVTPNK